MAGGVCWHAEGYLGIKGEKTPLFGCDLNNVMIKTLLSYEWMGVSQNYVFETIHRLSGEYIRIKPR